MYFLHYRSMDPTRPMAGRDPRPTIALVCSRKTFFLRHPTWVTYKRDANKNGYWLRHDVRKKARRYDAWVSKYMEGRQLKKQMKRLQAAGAEFGPTHLKNAHSTRHTFISMRHSKTQRRRQQCAHLILVTVSVPLLLSV